MSSTIAKRYSLAEEIANSVTHGLGALLAIAGLGVLCAFAALRGDAWHIVSCAVYAATLILCFGASTLYHAISHERAKAVLRTLDHSAIFLLIAGTYTPFTLVTLRGPWGWWLFGIIWGLALAGLVIQLTPLKKIRALSITLSALMGWVVIAAVEPLVERLAPGGLWLLVLGGLCYTGGIVFYLWRSLRFHHAIWHLFVLAGGVLHFFAVLFYVIP
ncbi:PAQR family membrane homeostasis protein TrhA [Microbulbifer thermotolerans]|uniref:Hemolysin III n=1 Tax=Microbulbifer thermotolerans TaxID=252514 RepID=A0A143HIP3_MICTH|nr:hemolysin III family protein [Microbulbifer thermotolerans]AMX01377.1 hemolysin III [Microbulbifer thermotolerans]MCX2780323.1 hemolysin III family protein [Microbulbifer thermotolerans]MCX2782786.1 hemolysin III family protein [Microbulbifer thermotolerans]MCX2795541.1 hemolysin III family protein [Microbulbifer thermotolerans]MCX2800254.1 hemolysin III family protein [Microbulbifer thermotolerans]